MAHSEVGVVIPYYHSDLKISESISLEQCIKVLGKYPVIFVVPDGMKEEEYPTVSGAIFKKVPKEWLISIDSYNRMMLTEDFYRLFEEYTYILIYQLDAFVFSDRLMEMCQYDYDYIGAPWLSGHYHYIDAKRCIWRVGNGGLSLRKVRSVIRLLEKGEQNSYSDPEDVFFAISDSADFKVAPVDIALKFSHEMEVKRCFELNKETLPFGCHAWERYDFDFWKPYIEKYGYDTELITVNDGKDDDKYQDGYIELRKKAFFWENIYSEDLLKLGLQKLFLKNIESYIIWGIGTYGQKVYRLLKEAGISIKCFVDNNKEFIGENKWGYEVRSIDNIKLTDKEAIIIAIKEQGYAVAEQLEQMGYIRCKDYILLDDLLAITYVP